MTNVLPPREKKRLWSFYRGRFILIGSIALSIVAVVALVAILPAYFLLAQNRSIIEEALAQQNKDAQAERAEAFMTQALLRGLQPYMSVQKTPMEYLEEALKNRPEGVSIIRMSFAREQSQNRIVLTGSAASRDQINALRKSLERTGAYTSVTVPVGDLVGASGNQFTLTLLAK